MEYCKEAGALKPSLRRELSFKSTQQTNSEDIWCFTAASNGVVSGEDFSVDCFFDFSNGELKESLVQEQDNHVEEEEEELEKDSLPGSSQEQVDDDLNSNSSTFSDSFFASELAVPVDDLADLEWVSHFVDDSLSEVSLLYPSGQVKTETHAKNRFVPESKPVLTEKTCFFAARVPVKARTKRSRPASRTWSVVSPHNESSSSSTSSVSSPLTLTNSVQPFDLFNGLGEPPMKKPKRTPTGGVMVPVQFQRRCSHCLVQKTPQWRTGPLGPKTLCNACGVRYKSGRLYPEYRPACSPTFSGDIHSNSHRKVLEMRRKKETGVMDSRFNQMVTSF